MIAERQARYPKGTYQVVVLPRQDGQVQFCLSNLYTGWCSRARSVWEFIKTVEGDITANKFPQSAIQYRSWGSPAQAQPGPAKPAASPEGAEEPAGKGGPTFILRVLYRQNATWQGTVMWMEGKQTRAFRSLNELLKLMDEAVEFSPNDTQKTQSLS